ncbi:hypothetical protein HYU13_05125 [Candidatus Woesearchaeota archaeon]|nr:hypothetical protein [Candidatus Woesearchaeota archaeon]
MAEVRTIKDVDQSTWSALKSMAATNNMKMGLLLDRMVRDYKELSRKRWDDILNSPPLFTEAEADAMLRSVMKVRKERGFRV